MGTNMESRGFGTRSVPLTAMVVVPPICSPRMLTLLTRGAAALAVVTIAIIADSANSERMVFQRVNRAVINLLLQGAGGSRSLNSKPKATAFL